MCSFNVEDAQYSHVPGQKRKREREYNIRTGSPVKRARKGREGPYSSFPRMELGSQGNAGKEGIGPRSSDSPASDEHMWPVNRHIAEHLQSLMLLTIRLIEL